jgi:hypothetical protein
LLRSGEIRLYAEDALMKPIWETLIINHRLPGVNDFTQYIRELKMASEEYVTIVDLSY